MRNFREDYPLAYQMSDERSPLIMIKKDRSISYAQSKKQKQEMLLGRTKTDKFIMPVAGKRRSDVFEVTENDIKEAIKTF